MDKQRMIANSIRYKEQTGTEMMVVYSKYGGYQGFPVREKIPEGYEVVFRTDEKMRISLDEAVSPMMDKFIGKSQN